MNNLNPGGMSPDDRQAIMFAVSLVVLCISIAGAQVGVVLFLLVTLLIVMT